QALAGGDDALRAGVEPAAGEVARHRGGDVARAHDRGHPRCRHAGHRHQPAVGRAVRVHDIERPLGEQSFHHADAADALAGELRLDDLDTVSGSFGEDARLARRGDRHRVAAAREARIFAEAPAYGVEIIEAQNARKGIGGVGVVKRLLAERPFDVVNTHSSTDSWLVTMAGVAATRMPAIVRTRHISSPVPRNFASRWLYARAERIVTTGERL